MSSKDIQRESPGKREEKGERSGVGSYGPCSTLGGYGATGAEFREVTFCAQVGYFRTICSELEVHFGPKVIPSSTLEPKVPQMDPRRPKGAKGRQK